MRDPEPRPADERTPGPDGGSSASASTEIGAYLDAFESSLDLPEPFRSEAREEIAGYLADSTATLEADGHSPAEAAREAVRRMGAPSGLGRDMTHARQTRRALLVAIGPGIWAAGGGALRGFVFGLALVTTGVLAVLLGLRGLQLAGLPLIDLSTVRIGNTQATFALGVAFCFAAWRGSRVIVSAISYRSRRQPEVLRPWIAAIGGSVTLALVLLWFRGAQDEVSVFALLAVPLAFVGGALTAVGRPIEPLRWPLVVVMTTLLVLVPVALLFAGAPVQKTLSAVGVGPFASMEELLRSENMDLPGRFVADPPDFGTISDSARGGLATVSLGPPSAGQAPRWHDIRLEAWRADLSTGPVLDRRFTSPFATTPLIQVGDRLEGSVRVDATRGVTDYWLVVTGVAADGQRDLLREVTGSNTDFVGTVWDWLTAP